MNQLRTFSLSALLLVVVTLCTGCFGSATVDSETNPDNSNPNIPADAGTNAVPTADAKTK